MGSALYIALEEDIAGLDPFVNGKYLAKRENELEKLAKRLGVTPLMEFFGISSSELEAFDDDFDDDFDMDDEDLEDRVEPEDDAAWFEATDGLETVMALLEHLAEHPEAIKDADDVIDDLKEFQEVLEKAEANGVLWHLSVDY